MKKRSVHIEDTMRLGQMLPTPVGSMPEILQLSYMLEQRVQSAREDTPLGGVDQRKCHKYFRMLSTVPRRNSQILPSFSFRPR